MDQFCESLYRLVRQIPRGKVTTYGQLALLLGRPKAARVVGGALHRAPQDVPCHRVVNRTGQTAPVFFRDGKDLQRMLLEEEGVEFLPDGRADLSRFFWGGIPE